MGRLMCVALQGAWADFSQAARQKVFSADTEEVLQLAVHLTQQLEAVGCNGRLVHIAHRSLPTSLCVCVCVRLRAGAFTCKRGRVRVCVCVFGQ